MKISLVTITDITTLPFAPVRAWTSCVYTYIFK